MVAVTLCACAVQAYGRAYKQFLTNMLLIIFIPQDDVIAECMHFHPPLTDVKNNLELCIQLELRGNTGHVASALESK
jgi:hypothetical protein